MSLTALVSYDDTPSDHDALMLARILGSAGARPLLVYVRHAIQSERAREELEEHEARELLERGARWLGEWHMSETTRVVVSASTAEGLRGIAGSERADLIIFGSEHRTAPGHISPQRSTQSLLDGGPTAVAIAPAGYRSDRVPRITTIGVSAASADDAAIVTARRLAEDRHADLVDHGRGRRPAGDRLAGGGAGRTRDGELAGSQRDRERDRAGAGHCPGRAAAVRSSGRCLSSRRPRRNPDAAIVGRLRTLLISDLHLGTRLGYDVLRRPVALERLLAALEDVDRLVLLGDTVELMEGRPQQAMTVAEPVLRAVGQVMGPDGEVIVVPGNHDRPLVRAWARRAGETLEPDSTVPVDASPALARLVSWLAPASVQVLYPGVWLDERVWVTHGHYLDWHLMPVSSFGFARGALRRLPRDEAPPIAYETANRPSMTRATRWLPRPFATLVDDFAMLVRASTMPREQRRRILGTRLSPLTSHVLGVADAPREHPGAGPRRPSSRHQRGMGGVRSRPPPWPARG